MNLSSQILKKILIILLLRRFKILQENLEQDDTLKTPTFSSILPSPLREKKLPQNI